MVDKQIRLQDNDIKRLKQLSIKAGGTFNQHTFEDDGGERTYKKIDKKWVLVVIIPKLKILIRKAKV